MYTFKYKYIIKYDQIKNKNASLNKQHFRQFNRLIVLTRLSNDTNTV